MDRCTGNATFFFAAASFSALSSASPMTVTVDEFDEVSTAGDSKYGVAK
jgi:hypothetical protein